MHENTNSHIDPNGIRHIPYGDIHQYSKFTQNELRCISYYRIYARVYSLACITTGDVIWFKIEYLKATTNPLKSPLGCPATALGGLDKALYKQAVRTITSQNVTLIQSMGKWTRTGHIQQTEVLTPAKVILAAVSGKCPEFCKCLRFSKSGFATFSNSAGCQK